MTEHQHTTAEQEVLSTLAQDGYQLWLPTTLEGVLDQLDDVTAEPKGTLDTPASRDLFIVEVTPETRIDYFTGAHAFLDNDAPVPNKLMHGSSAEHLYQAFKTEILEERLLVLSGRTPEEAREFGMQVTLHQDWDEHKLWAMQAVLAVKFGEVSLREQLLATGTALLSYGNDHCDIFWGACWCPVHRASTGVAVARGQNMLGTLLMQLRQRLLTQGSEAAYAHSVGGIKILIERLDDRSARDKAGLAGD